jgi:patatin-like phospholipase/acyl hydrolase
MTKKTVVLSLDGGGLKGVIQLKILQELDKIIKETGVIGFDKKMSNNLMDYIDIVGGVSIGSIVATGLLLKDAEGRYKYSLEDAVEKIKTLPEKIFVKNWIPFFQSVLKGDAVANGIAEIFGKDSTFDDLVGDKKLLITSTNLDTCKPTIWTNMIDKENMGDLANGVRYVDVDWKVDGEKVKLHDAITSSSSYLLALPAHKVKYKLINEGSAKERLEVDAGYINKTPHLDLLSTLTTCGKGISDILMIGVGTGTADFDATNISSGSAVSYIWDLLFASNFDTGVEEARQDNSSRAIDNIIRANGGKSYLLDVPVPAELYKQSFSPGAVKEYISIAEDWCSANHDQLKDLADTLIANYYS